MGIVIVAIMVALFLWMHRRRHRFEDSVKTEPELGFAYEWVATPARKAKKDLLNRFPELTEVVDAGFSADLNLVRFAIFNLSKEIIAKEHFIRPVEIRFPAGKRISTGRMKCSLAMISLDKLKIAKRTKFRSALKPASTTSVNSGKRLSKSFFAFRAGVATHSYANPSSGSVLTESSNRCRRRCIHKNSATIIATITMPTAFSNETGISMMLTVTSRAVWS